MRGRTAARCSKSGVEGDQAEHVLEEHRRHADRARWRGRSAAAIGTPSMPQRVDSEPSATATTVGGARLLELADDQRAEVGERRLRPVDRATTVARPASRAGRRSRSPVPWNRLRCSPIVNSRIRLQDEQLDLGDLGQVDERRRRRRCSRRSHGIGTRSTTSSITASVVRPWLAACGPSQMRWPRTYGARSWMSSGIDLGRAAARAAPRPWPGGPSR